MEEAFNHHGRPEMVNIDQAANPPHEFVQVANKQGCKLSMDGYGAWRDSVFIERLWKPVKYERVYLHAYDSITEARRSVIQYMPTFQPRQKNA